MGPPPSNPTVPVAVGATLALPSHVLTINYSGPLQPGSVPGGNFRAFVNGAFATRFTPGLGVNGAASGSSVTIVVGDELTTSAPTHAEYDGTPGGLFSAAGDPIVADTNIPLTVL